MPVSSKTLREKELVHEGLARFLILQIRLVETIAIAAHTVTHQSTVEPQILQSLHV